MENYLLHWDVHITYVFWTNGSQWMSLYMARLWGVFSVYSYFQVALGYSEKYGSEKVRVLTFVNNRGKGGAVRLVSWIYIIFRSTWVTSHMSLVVLSSSSVCSFAPCLVSSTCIGLELRYRDHSLKSSRRLGNWRKVTYPRSQMWRSGMSFKSVTFDTLSWLSYIEKIPANHPSFPLVNWVWIPKITSKKTEKCKFLG
jgi:hypothetical protein